MIAPKARFVVAALVVLVVASCSTDGDSSGAQVLVGSVTATGSTALVGSETMQTDLVIDSNSPFAATCEGSGTYEGLTEGAAVEVRNGDRGEVVASGSLNGGQLIFVEAEADPLGSGDCMWEFSVPDVPTADTYSIHVVDLAEDAYTAEELESTGWTIEMRVQG